MSQSAAAGQKPPLAQDPPEFRLTMSITMFLLKPTLRAMSRYGLARRLFPVLVRRKVLNPRPHLFQQLLANRSRIRTSELSQLR